MELIHALNRGVEKRDIFLDDEDRARFVHDLFEFNDQDAAGSTYYSFRNRSPGNILDLRSPEYCRKRIVDIHGWVLMRNHYHLLISERIDGGSTLFLRKLNIGYAKYFNEKYNRSGTLFQGRTKKKAIDSDAYFLHILHYIHLNPLDYESGSADWRIRKIHNAQKAIAQLQCYRWSSYADYCGRKNFPSILTTELYGEVFGDYEAALKTYLKEIETADIQAVILE